MGCNCGKSRMPKPSPGPIPEARAGDWVVRYPSGKTEVFGGPRAKQQAQREAIATGGKTYRVPPV